MYIYKYMWVNQTPHWQRASTSQLQTHRTKTLFPKRLKSPFRAQIGDGCLPSSKRSTDRSRDATRSLLWEGNNPFDRRKVSFSWWKQMLIDDRKGLFYKPKLTFWRCRRLVWKQWKEKTTGFFPKLTCPLRTRMFQTSKPSFFSKR